MKPIKFPWRLFSVVLVALVLVAWRPALLTADPQWSDDALTGTVVGAYNNSLVLALRNNSNIVELRAHSDTRITRNGRPAGLYEMLPGDVAKVRVEWRQPVALATRIDAHSPY